MSIGNKLWSLGVTNFISQETQGFQKVNRLKKKLFLFQLLWYFFIYVFFFKFFLWLFQVPPHASEHIQKCDHVFIWQVFHPPPIKSIKTELPIKKNIAQATVAIPNPLMILNDFTPTLTKTGTERNLHVPGAWLLLKAKTCLVLDVVWQGYNLRINRKCGDSIGRSATRRTKQIWSRFHLEYHNYLWLVVLRW